MVSGSKSRRDNARRRLDRQIELGLCHRISCENKPTKDRTCCPKHLEDARRRHKQKLKEKR